jgi:hypothetical protein
VHVTRSSIDQSTLNSDDEGAVGELQPPYERDEDGEKLLLQLLGSQFQAQAMAVDVDMDDESSSSKKRKVEDEESLHDKPTDEQEEVFGQSRKDDSSSCLPNSLLCFPLPSRRVSLALHVKAQQEDRPLPASFCTLRPVSLRRASFSASVSTRPS